jgi:hypothetical protein
VASDVLTSDLSPAVIQAAAQAIDKGTSQDCVHNDDNEYAVFCSTCDATLALAAAAPLIRAEALRDAATKVEATGDGFKPEIGPLGDGGWYADLYATFLRGLAEEGTE